MQQEATPTARQEAHKLIDLASYGAKRIRHYDLFGYLFAVLVLLFFAAALSVIPATYKTGPTAAWNVFIGMCVILWLVCGLAMWLLEQAKADATSLAIAKIRQALEANADTGLLDTLHIHLYLLDGGKFNKKRVNQIRALIATAKAFQKPSPESVLQEAELAPL